MTQHLSVKISDELDTRIRAAAGDNRSQWVVEAIEDRLERDMWARSKEVDRLLGLDDAWLAEERKAVDEVQRAAR
ncbi:hypothetical protein HLB23_21195 [Nocardia uniformis]|uniref:Uncharacterized protein n=1 Tax=Nocardia uniformis TaxID=53432 RepID=A0A849C145_9NOCA|nr:hypothetical protein [Nocardia uniformis]NNH72344.1 hypothetical protein [Nocardia uniformis]